jgi:hypothetical protein
MELDIASLVRTDMARRAWILDWLAAGGLPVVATGSYYVKSFRLAAPAPAALGVLQRDGLVRLCFKPPMN